jgi:hypothetical protein
MIIPTAEFDPMFANDGIPFREKMLAYLEREFADLLRGPARDLIDSAREAEAPVPSSDRLKQVIHPPEENRNVA